MSSETTNENVPKNETTDEQAKVSSVAEKKPVGLKVQTKVSSLPRSSPYQWMQATSSAQGAKLQVLTQGDPDSPALLMISGKSCTLNMWRGLDRRMVEAGFFVITFDNRDMGQSTNFSDQLSDPEAELEKSRRGESYVAPYSLSDLAEDCIAVIDHLKIDKVHVFGACLGGLIAQILAVQHSDRVKSLATIMTAIDINAWSAKGFAANDEFFGKMLATSTPTAEMGKEEFLANRVDVWRILLTDLAHPELNSVEENLLLMEMSEDFERGAVDWEDKGGMRQLLATIKWTESSCAEHRLKLEKLKLKTLILHGKYDPLLPEAAATELKSVIPEAVAKTYHGGHNMPLDEQDQISYNLVVHLIAAEQ